MRLRVTRPFGVYRHGEVIATKSEIEAALRDNPQSVVRIADPAPRPAPKVAPDATVAEELLTDRPAPKAKKTSGATPDAPSEN